MNKSKNLIFVITIIIIIIVFFSIYYVWSFVCLDCGISKPKENPYVCSSQCKLVSVSNDKNLYDFFEGVDGSVTPIEWINVSCVSEEYYNLNNQKY